MSKHTAGPWRFWTQRRPGKEDTCTFQNLDGVEVLRAVTTTLTEADACLIAAAPELLAALQASIELADRNRYAAELMGRKITRPPEMQAVYDACVAATLKATRGTP